jgi:membrane protease YdiL (CAAX protease family)
VAAAATHLAVLVLIRLLAETTGHSPSFRDAGDIFVKLGEVAAYTDERLQAAAAGSSLPDPPRLLGDVVTARIAYSLGVVNLVLLSAIVVAAGGLRPRQFAVSLGLHRFDFNDAWRPLLAAALVSMALAGYAAGTRGIGIEWLEPGDAAPGVVLRDGWVFALFAMVAVGLAPFAEELFFRGLVFGGLLPLGALPAALGSALLFAAWHMDIAALIPVTSVGLVLAWLFWRSGSLWDSIVFHLAFNAVGLFQVIGANR